MCVCVRTCVRERVYVCVWGGALAHLFGCECAHVFRVHVCLCVQRAYSKDLLICSSTTVVVHVQCISANITSDSVYVCM